MTTLANNRFSQMLAIMVSAVLLLTGCSPMYRWVKCPSYVVFYTDLNSIKFSIEHSNPHCIMIDHGGPGYEENLYGLHSNGASKDKYEELCRKHNDLSYNQYHLIGGTLDIESVGYNDCDFTGISITADRYFDANHPAGTSLADIVRFMSWSPYKYILSGYSRYYHYDKADVSEAFDNLMRIYINSEWFDKDTDAECYPVDKLVRDLTQADMVLLGHNAPGFIGMLYFEKTPEIKGEYGISVTFNADNGKTFKDTIKMTF